MPATPTGATVDVTRVREFSERVHVAAQQKKSRLKDKSIIKMFNGKDMAYDGLGTIEAVENNSRYAKLDFQDLEHRRRQILPKRFTATLPIEKKDTLEAILDVKNNYAEAVANAMVRKMDEIGARALLADVNTGEDFQTPLTAAADGVITIDATAGLTYDILLDIDQNFIDADLGIEMDEFTKHLMISGKEHTSLMKENQLTSGDYTRQFAVEKGRIQNAAGFDLIKYAAGAANPIINEATNRECIAFTENALCYGMLQDFEFSYREHDEYVAMDSITVIGYFGAVRTEGARVIKVDTAI